jgi:N-acetyl sugar amidotransferase
LLSKHRGKYGKYDCVVPGSGGKDSCYAAHVLKHKYGMSPLTVTWPPILYTKYGKENYLNWLKSGNFKNITPKRNEKLMKFLTKKSIENLFHPFQTFILGQKNFPIKTALKYKIPLVFYGENEAEHGNSLTDNLISLRNESYHTYNNLEKIYLAGISYNDLVKKYKFNKKDIDIFLPPKMSDFKSSNVEVHYLGYYLKWTPQETFYYSVENCNFKPRPFRTEGTYSKYNSIDDKIDDFHYYTTFIKFGIGRATYDVSQEIRNNHLNIEEGKKLIKKYDGELPSRYFKEVLNYIGLKPKEFHKLTDTFRSPHLWKKTFAGWKLRHTVNRDGFND